MCTNMISWRFGSIISSFMRVAVGQDDGGLVLLLGEDRRSWGKSEKMGGDGKIGGGWGWEWQLASKFRLRILKCILLSKLIIRGCALGPVLRKRHATGAWWRRLRRGPVPPGPHCLITDEDLGRRGRLPCWLCQTTSYRQLRAVNWIACGEVFSNWGRQTRFDK